MNIEIANLQPGTSYVLQYTLTECNHEFYNVTVPFVTDANGSFTYTMPEANQGDLDLVWSVLDDSGNAVDSGSGVKLGTYDVQSCCLLKPKVPETDIELIMPVPDVPDFVMPSCEKPKFDISCMLHALCTVLESIDNGVLTSNGYSASQVQALIDQVAQTYQLALASLLNQVNSEVNNAVTLHNQEIATFNTNVDKSLADLCMKIEEILNKLPGKTVQ